MCSAKSFDLFKWTNARHVRRRWMPTPSNVRVGVQRSASHSLNHHDDKVFSALTAGCELVAFFGKFDDVTIAI
jgi:hypothetical protein